MRSRPSPNRSSCSIELQSKTKFPKAFLLALLIMFCFNQICTFRQRQSILRIMEEFEASWYDEDDASEVEEDLNFDSDTVSAKKDSKNQSAQCPECKKVFTQKSSMKLHLRTIHHDDSRHVKCPKCEKMLSSKISLATHLKSVRPAKQKVTYKPAQCPECEKVFTQTQNMKIHLRSIHQGIRLKCEYCGQTATNKSNLQKHIRLYCPSKPI